MIEAENKQVILINQKNYKICTEIKKNDLIWLWKENTVSLHITYLNDFSVFNLSS